MSKPIRVGIVGSGFAASFHAACLRRVSGPAVELAGVYSPTTAHCAAFAAKEGCKAFGSLDALIQACDVVDICALGAAHEPVAVRAAGAGRHVIVEKPFTGYFGPPEAGEEWRGDAAGKAAMLEEAMAGARRMVGAAESAGITLCYAENWVYAPSLAKEREVLAANNGQILWMIGEESHSGSHSPAYGVWRKAGGGSLLGKGCHPLTAALHLKRFEGERRDGRPIRPASVSARTHRITGNPLYRDAGFLRTGYFDGEDFCQLHVVFEDGMVADIFASEIVMGGVHNWLEVFANNHRMRCNISPVDACALYNPKEELLADVYLVEKLGTKQGWSLPSPDEHWMSGYPQEMQDFMESMASGRRPLCGAELGLDTVAVMYAAYLSAERGGAEVETPR